MGANGLAENPRDSWGASSLKKWHPPTFWMAQRTIMCGKIQKSMPEQTKG